MGKVKVVFPSVLGAVTNGEKTAEVEAANLSEVLHKLTERYGEKFAKRIFESPGKVRHFLNFYVNGKNIRHLDGVDTPLSDGDEVSILPAVSGG